MTSIIVCFVSFIMSAMVNVMTVLYVMLPLPSSMSQRSGDRACEVGDEEGVGGVCEGVGGACKDSPSLRPQLNQGRHLISLAWQTLLPYCQHSVDSLCLICCKGSLLMCRNVLRR